MKAAARIRRFLGFLTDPQYRKLHAAVIAFALLSHLSLHYALYLPALRAPLGNLPYFRLHPLHEAEFLLIVAYAGVTFRWKGALIAIAVTGITSIPFILTPYIFGRAPRPDELRDAAIQVSFILLMGFLIVALYITDTKRRDLAAAAEVLKEADEVKSRFISIASHELRTPLTAILGFSELLTRPQVSEQQRAEWSAWINAQSRRLAEMLDDLLNVSRIQSGKMTLRREPVDFVATARDAVRVVGPPPSHSVAIEVPAGLPRVWGDSDKLLQVVVNLVSNAVKYSPSGGQIKLAAEPDPARGCIVVSVSDGGIGISEADQVQLFTTFHRISRPETQGVSGSGLGLYIVKSLVEMMGGEVWVRSELGKGSTFAFSLSAVPAGQPVGESAEGAHAQEVTPGR